MWDSFLHPRTSYFAQKYLWKKGQAAKFCLNCHTHFHEYSKKKTTNPQDADEARKIWYTWLKTVSVVVTILILGIMFFS